MNFWIKHMPFSLVPELMKVGNWGMWLSIPITAHIGYVYVMMGAYHIALCMLAEGLVLRICL
jgi:hypothetical protein